MPKTSGERYLSFLLLLLFMIGLPPLHAQEIVKPVPPRYISVKKLRADLLKGRHFKIFDVRSAYAYRMEHIKGAESLPIQEISYSSILTALPKNTPIVTYCSCPHHLAEMAFQILKQKGFTNVLVLDEGIPGWKKDNYPLEGTLADKPVEIFWILGYAYGPHHAPRSGVEVRGYQEKTQQLEIDKTDRRGFYAMALRFYGLEPGDQLQASIGGDMIFFTVGKKTKIWGTRIDDENGEVVIKDGAFLKTFKSHKLHP